MPAFTTSGLPGDLPAEQLTDRIDQLTEQLATATAAASDAYRHTARLIRVLTVLGQPSSPSELVEQALLVLSQVFAADVVATVRVVTGRLLLTGACGVPEDDAAYVSGWPLHGSAAEAVERGRTVARCGTALDRATDLPPSLAELSCGSAVWVPVSGAHDSADELLMMYRRSPEPFDGTELQVLASVAERLRVAVESRERGASVELLARYGHRLARCLDLPSLFDTATRLLPGLINADSAILVTIESGEADLRAYAVRRGFVTPPQLATNTPDAAPIDDHSDTASSYTLDESSTHVASAYGTSAEADNAVPPVDEREPNWPQPASSIWGWEELVRGKPYRANRDLRGVAGTVLAVPVVRDGRTDAVLYAHRRNHRAFGKHDVDAATIFASYVGAAMTNAELYRALGESESSLRRQATHDPLTGLANRALTMEWLNNSLRSGQKGNVGLLFCDLDRFKEVNDRLGHEAGDELLEHVAARLHNCVRQDDLLARFGGDEFVVALAGVSSLTAVREVGERVVAALHAPFPLRGEWVSISASVGGVLGVCGRTTGGAMLRDADAAMYVAKTNGRGRVEVFDDAASHRSLDRLEIRSELGNALTDGQLHLHYQPIFNLESGEILGFEALSRWQHPVRGSIPPDVFIPLAEETGAIIGIGEWVLDEACRQLASWNQLLDGTGHPRLRISVNLSATQLHQEDLATRTLKVIRDAGVRPDDVWLEVTEHSSIRTDVTEFATTLRAAGVHFALDDFGISYSNLSHLKRLPVEILKIDRSFVAGLPAKDTDRGIVRAVLAIADSLGLTVVAEGVETQEQRKTLLSLGCWQAQGYLLSRPVPSDKATEMLLDIRTLAQVGVA